MPIYAYECKDCGVRFERRQGFDDSAISVCPECEGRVHRLIQPAGIVFKGSGFYVTDHKSSKSSTASPGTKKSETSTAESTPSPAKSEASTAKSDA